MGAGEAELRAALRRVVVPGVSPGDSLPGDDPDWRALDAAITELVRLRATLVECEADNDAYVAEARALRAVLAGEDAEA